MGVVRCWLAGTFGILFLFASRLSNAQSFPPPPRPSSPPPSPRSPPPPFPAAPHQTVPLSLVDLVTKASLCSRVQESGCLGELEWLIDLDPYPLTSETSGAPTAGLTCIGANGTGCLWGSAREYIAYTGSDTYVYVPVGLTIKAQNITRMFQFGHATYAGQILRQLRTLSITCTDPVPVFAPYVLEPLVMALAAAGMDNGIAPAGARAASTPPPPPPPAAAAASAPPGNTSSDAAYNATLLQLAYSRLYTRPTLGSPLLRSLSILDCALTGQLPPASFWLQLPSLDRLDLSHNQLSGPLPATFGPAPPLSYLNLSHNRISGPLTASLVRYGGCGRTMDLSYNNLRGAVPDAWLSSACTLHGKIVVGMGATARRRRLNGQSEGQQEEAHESGPEGGVAKVASSSYLSYRAAKTTATAVTEATAPSSNSVTGGSMTKNATTSDSYPFWLSYPMSYMYGGDDCPMFGVAWDQEVAARVHNGTAIAAAAGVKPRPLAFTVLLYGNPLLDTPGSSQTGYATAASRHLHFSVRENACTVFDPLSDLLWVWGSFGCAALIVLLVAMVHALLAMRRAGVRVAPSAVGAGNRQTFRSRSWRRMREAPPPAAPAPAPAAGDSVEQLATSSAATAGGGAGGGGGDSAPAGAGLQRGAMAWGQAGGATSEQGDASAAAATATSPNANDVTDGSGDGGGSSRDMARLIIVAHARRYSARAVRRLSLYGTALADVLEGLVVWLLCGFPWGQLVHAVVAAAVHLGAAGLTYALSLPQRTVYCNSVRHCGPYLYVVPAVLSALSIGLTIFLMRATRELAGSMAAKVPGAGKPGSSETNVVPFSEGSSGGPGARPDAVADFKQCPADGDTKAAIDGGCGGGDCGRGSGCGSSGDGGRRGSSASGECTEARSTPLQPQTAAVVVAAAAGAVGEGEGWVSGLQPRRSAQSCGTFAGAMTSQGSAEPQQLLAPAVVPGSLPMYDAEALPVPARLGGASGGSSPRAAPPSVARSPRASSRFLPGGGGGGGGGSCTGSPLRPLMAPGAAGAGAAVAAVPSSSTGGDNGPRRGGSGGGGGVGAGNGPVAEALEPGGGSGRAAAAVAVPAAATPVRQRRSRRGLFAWVHGGPAAAAPAEALLPASPYGSQLSGQQHKHHPADATRARASLDSSCRFGRRPGPGGESGLGHRAAAAAADATAADRYAVGCERPIGGFAEALAPALGPGSDDRPGTPSTCRGPVAEADEGDGAADGASHSRNWSASQAAQRALSRAPKPPPLPPLGHGSHGSADRVTGASFGTPDGSYPASSGPSAALLAVGGGGGGAVGDARSGGGLAAEQPSRPAQRKPSRREELRPPPVLTNLRGTPGLISPSAAASPSAAGPLGPTGRIGCESDSPMPYSTVEPLRPPPGRSLANSTSVSTHGSHQSRAGIDSDAAAGGWLGAPSVARAAGVLQPMDPRVAVVLSLPVLPLESPGPGSPAKPGGPWLEDRLAALATLSSGAGGGATAVLAPGAVAPRMPSVAAAAAVAAAAPRRDVGRGGPAAAMGAGAGAGAPAAAVPKLQPEALRVVSQYLRDYATGKKGSGWRSRSSRVATSAAVVTLVFTPLAPLAALVAVVAALVIVLHAVARAGMRALRSCSGRIRRQQQPPGGGGGGGGAAAMSRFDRLAASLRLSGQLLLALHLHVAGWLLCVPLALYSGVLYGMGYAWGKDAVPLPWVFLAANCASLAGVLLLLLDLVTQMRAWEHGVCTYPYRVVLQATATAAAAAPAAAPVAGVEAGR